MGTCFTNEKSYELGSDLVLSVGNFVNGDGTLVARIYEKGRPEKYAMFTSQGLMVGSENIKPDFVYAVIEKHKELLYKLVPARVHLLTYYCYGGIKLYAQSGMDGGVIAYFDSERGEHCSFDVETGDIIDDTFTNPFVCETLKHEVDLRRLMLKKYRPKHLVEVLGR